jgi:hypothetical protein
MAPLSLSLALRCGAVHSAPLSRLSPPRPAPLQLRRARLVLGARTARVVTARRAAVCAASGEEESSAEPAPAAPTDNSGYESSGDENVLSGKGASVAVTQPWPGRSGVGALPGAWPNSRAASVVT